MMEMSRLTKTGSNTLIWGGTGEQPFAPSKVCHHRDMARQNNCDTDHPGMPLVDIREFFGSGNDQKPGKKGISLKAEEVNQTLCGAYYNNADGSPQWQTLKQNTEAIDEMLSHIKRKD